MELKWDAQGLIVAVAQDYLSGELRMVAWMNAEALEQTLETGFATFFSRSRGRLWQKGETSGNRLRIHEIAADCDGDTLVLRVDPEGPSCHTGRESCFFVPVSNSAAPPADDEEARLAQSFLFDLEDVIESRSASSAEKSYTKSLLQKGAPKIGAKLQEEAGELADAIAGESDERVTSEAADVLYHLMVGLRSRGVELRDVVAELARRSGVSGHEEKAARPNSGS